MRTGRVGRQGWFSGVRLKLFVLAVIAIALYCVIAKPTQSAGAIAHVAHSISIFVQSFK